MRYEFLLALIKIGIDKYLSGGATNDVSEAVEMLMANNIAKLPAEAISEDAVKAFRERELYTQDTEAIFVKELPALRALFECYADGGGGGRAALMPNPNPHPHPIPHPKPIPNPNPKSKPGPKRKPYPNP